jgi:Na+/proline symporter
VNDAAWMKFWRFYIIFSLIKSVIVVVWFTFGGLNDLKRMVASLKTAKRDDTDDGFVRSEKTEG